MDVSHTKNRWHVFISGIEEHHSCSMLKNDVWRYKTYDFSAQKRADE
jgi:hypothetical protein